MRKRIEVDTQLEHPVERVFAYLADPMKWHDFAPAVVLRHPISDGPVRIGSRWSATDRIIFFKIHFIDELVEYEPHRRAAWRSSAPWNALTTYACEPMAGGTRVRATYEGEVSGWLRILSYVPDVVLWWVLSGDFRRLRRRLAADAQAGAGVGARASG
jgi:uncharacterized protein YndB with AHSA1/START domain